jgi:cell shape-determining protein MreC
MGMTKRFTIKTVEEDCIFDNQDCKYYDELNMTIELLNEYDNKVNELEKENEQLKERNNRQAKTLDNLYRLIEEKDWRTLTDIIDDFKRCEEQLKKEWGTYGDVE